MLHLPPLMCAHYRHSSAFLAELIGRECAAVIHVDMSGNHCPHVPEPLVDTREPSLSDVACRWWFNHAEFLAENSPGRSCVDIHTTFPSRGRTLPEILGSSSLYSKDQQWQSKPPHSDLKKLQLSQSTESRSMLRGYPALPQSRSDAPFSRVFDPVQSICLGMERVSPGSH